MCVQFYFSKSIAQMLSTSIFDTLLGRSYYAKNNYVAFYICDNTERIAGKNLKKNIIDK